MGIRYFLTVCVVLGLGLALPAWAADADARAGAGASAEEAVEEKKRVWADEETASDPPSDPPSDPLSDPLRALKEAAEAEAGDPEAEGQAAAPEDAPAAQAQSAASNVSGSSSIIPLQDSVRTTGELVYNYPLDIPEFFGISPKLSLQYKSGAITQTSRHDILVSGLITCTI